MINAYAYPARLETDDDGNMVVSFRDVPEALTDGADRTEALAEAPDALVAALAGYVDDARNPRPLPKPTRARKGEVMVAVPLVPAAKLALHEAMRAQDLNGAKLARKLKQPVTAVRRLLSLDHTSKIEHIIAALNALGRTAELAVSEVR